MAEAMRIGYSDVFARNEYAYDLSDEKFRNLLVEMTGKDKNASSIKKIVATWKACKSYADFDANLSDSSASDIPDAGETVTEIGNSGTVPNLPSGLAETPKSVGMSFGYNINLNLPATTDAKVYNAIFSALQQTLLKE
jgi:hypothetical protein